TSPPVTSLRSRCDRPAALADAHQLQHGARRGGPPGWMAPDDRAGCFSADVPHHRLALVARRRGGSSRDGNVPPAATAAPAGVHAGGSPQLALARGDAAVG